MSDQKKKFVPVNNTAEQLKDVAQTVASAPKNVAKDIMETAMEQIGLKPTRKPLMGEISLLSGIHKTNQQIEKKEASIDAKMRQLEYVHNQEKQVFNARQQQIEKQVASLMDQLSKEVTKLEQQTAELTSEVRSTAVAMTPSKPGIYHLNFFDWVIGSLRDLRKKVNESRLWLNVWAKKKKQKGYWAMYKKHGSNFSDSGERAISTSGG